MKTEVNVDYIPGKIFPFSGIPFQMRGTTVRIVAFLQQPSEAFHKPWLQNLLANRSLIFPHSLQVLR